MPLSVSPQTGKMGGQSVSAALRGAKERLSSWQEFRRQRYMCVCGAAGAGQRSGVGEGNPGLGVGLTSYSRLDGRVIYIPRHDLFTWTDR